MSIIKNLGMFLKKPFQAKNVFSFCKNYLQNYEFCRYNLKKFGIYFPL